MNKSTFTRAQRVACIFCALFLTMITSAMFYRTEDDVERPVIATIGPFTVSLQVSFWQSLIILIMSIFTVRKRSCRKVIFSQACVNNSVHGGRCTHTPWEDTSPQADTPWADNPPPRQTSTLGRHPQGRHTCPGQTHTPRTIPRLTPLSRQPPSPQQTATAADGTHPTGMHSCRIYDFLHSLACIP